MTWGKELWRRLLYLKQRSRLQSDLSDEVQFHMESRAEELEQEGMSRQDALAQAHREFGPSRRAVEDTHGAWQFRWIEELFSDLRYAARAFRRNPAFALTAICCLALGIGANLTIFSLTSSFLFSQPSARDAGSLVSILEGGNSHASMNDYKFLRATRGLDSLIGLNVEHQMNLREGDRTSRLFAGLATDNFFEVVGAPFLLGRGIAPGEIDTAVLSYRFWRNHFSSDPAVLGRKVILDGQIYSVVGVLPSDHRTLVGFGFAPELYVPATHATDFLQLYARIPDGMNIAGVRTRVLGMLRELDHAQPQGWKRADNLDVTAVSGRDALGRKNMLPIVVFFAMLMIMVGLVLLIACTNVASLLLARASSRSQELAIRASLGAGRSRIVRHLLAESLLLAACGAAAGLALEIACARMLSEITLPVPAPMRFIVSTDWRLLAYSVCVVIVTAVVSGLIPAWKAARKDVNAALKSEERQTGRAWGLRSILVAGQLAISIVLLSAGFLFLHNLLQATAMNPGFDADRTVVAYMRLVPEKYTDSARQNVLVRQALARLSSLPGVEAATMTRIVPLNDNCQNLTSVRTNLSPNAIDIRYQCNNIGPDYFRALGIPILEGREFSAQDGHGAEPAVVVNETFAHTVFGNTNPVGQTIRLGDAAKRIIGVARDSKYATLGESPKLALYEPFSDNETQISFIVRTASSPASFVKPVTEILSGLDASAAIETKPMSQALALALLPSRAGAAMLGTMGVLGLTLAAIGLYGVLLYSVSQRSREIGVRVALGATPSEILRLVCRHSLALTGSGMAVGLFLAFFATRPLAMFLVPGVNASDPAAFLAVVGVLGAVALFATLAPAVRALRLDPMSALRHE